MERILQTFKNPHKLSLILAVLFFVGIIASFIVLFTLPHNLVFRGGMTSSGLATAIYAKLFLIVGITFALGVIAINVTLKAKKEIVVFKEKTNEKDTTLNSTEENHSTLDLQSFSNSIKNEKAGTLFQTGLNAICKFVEAGLGAFYILEKKDGKRIVELRSAYALLLNEEETIAFEVGEGLIGQVAASGKKIYLDELPEGYSKAIVSGLGMAAPKFLFVIPIKRNNEVLSILEIATFSPLSESRMNQMEQMAGILTERI